jgi:hypothetical protein
MPRGGGVVAIGTIRRSLPSARAALITATREENADPAGCCRRQGGRGRPGGLAWSVQETERPPTLRSAKTQISWALNIFREEHKTEILRISGNAGQRGYQDTCPAK